MIMKKLTAGLTLAVLLTLPGLSVGASAVPVQPRLIPLTDFFPKSRNRRLFTLPRRRAHRLHETVGESA